MKLLMKMTQKNVVFFEIVEKSELIHLLNRMIFNNFDTTG